METGQQAPDFILYNTEKTKVSLYDQKGKNVVLLFFPLAFTSVCTGELCSVRDNISLYNEANAVVFGISIDSLFTLKKYKESMGLNFELLSDFNKTVSREYGALYDVFPTFEMEGVTKRAAFVLDKEGVIHYAEVCPTPQHLPDFGAIQVKLASLNG